MRISSLHSADAGPAFEADCPAEVTARRLQGLGGARRVLVSAPASYR